MSEIILEQGVLIWQPYIRIIYETRKKRNDILVDALLPAICNDPITAILLARKTSLMRLSEEQILGKGIFLKPALDGPSIIEIIKQAFDKVEELLEASQSSFREELQLNIDWQRYRAIFIPTRRLIERKAPIFRYFLGRTEAHPYAIALFLKNLIRNGLNITDRNDIRLISSERAYYPLVITDNLKIFEIAWRLQESLTYDWVINHFPQAKELYENIIKGEKEP